MKEKVSFIINIKNGKPVSLSFVFAGKPYILAAGHHSFSTVIKELKQPEPDGAKIIRIITWDEAAKAFTEGKVKKKGEDFFFRGEKISGVLVNRIREFMKLDYPWQPMFRFLENLMLNPSEHSRKFVYTFLENENLTLTPDGCFLGYKGANADFWSKNIGHHTMISGRQNAQGQIFYGKGEKVRVPWDEVVANPALSCARGLHVGSFSYANNWAGPNGALVSVKVNPKDVVSVTNSCKEVMRVCAYEVVQVLTIREALKQTFDPQFIAPDDKDAALYHNTRDSKGRFVKASIR